MLCTMCRQLMARQASIIADEFDPNNEEPVSTDWLSFIRVELERRLIYFTWGKRRKNNIVLENQGG